ncbi:MAG: hypothetical protein ACI32B_07145 [Erysipelotrichaceae bacterium]
MNKRTGLLYKIAICLLVLVAIVALSFSFAAYTSFNTAKRVVSTTKAEDVRFSSNYLVLTDINDNSFTSRKVTTTDNEDTSKFTLQICNYIYGNEAMFNSKNIDYTLNVNIVVLDLDEVELNQIKIKKNNNESFPTENKSFSIESTLNGGAAHIDNYVFSFPESYKSKIRFEISAKPTDASKSATNDKKLSANITLSTLVISNGWSGKFIDDKTSKNVKDYDGFNYELSGKGSGVIKLTIDERLCLSKWFITDNCIPDPVENTKEDGSKTYSYLLYVPKDVEAFQFQLYRNKDNPIDDAMSWTALSNMVTVKYPVSNSGVTGCRPVESQND